MMTKIHASNTNSTEKLVKYSATDIKLISNISVINVIIETIVDITNTQEIIIPRVLLRIDNRNITSVHVKKVRSENIHTHNWCGVEKMSSVNTFAIDDDLADNVRTFFSVEPFCRLVCVSVYDSSKQLPFVLQDSFVNLLTRIICAKRHIYRVELDKIIIRDDVYPVSKNYCTSCFMKLGHPLCIDCAKWYDELFEFYFAITKIPIWQTRLGFSQEYVLMTFALKMNNLAQTISVCSNKLRKILDQPTYST